MGARLEASVGSSERALLIELLRARRGTFSTWFREKVDDELKRTARQRRIAAAAELCGLNFDFALDPPELQKLIDEQYDPLGPTCSPAS